MAENAAVDFLDHLIAGRTIDVYSAASLFGIEDLGAAAGRLKRLGVRLVAYPGNVSDGKGRVAGGLVFRLNPESLDAARQLREMAAGERSRPDFPAHNALFG